MRDNVLQEARAVLEAADARSFAAALGVASTPTRPHEVFVSYAHEDQVAADRLVASLESAGYPSWIAHRDIPAGHPSWPTAIAEAIESSHRLVAVLSRHSIASRHIERELTLADQAGVTLAAVRLDATPLTPALRYLLAGVQVGAVPSR